MQDKTMGKDLMNGQKKSTTSMKSTKKEEPHLQILSSHKHIYDLFVQTGEVVNLHPHIKDEIVSAYRVEHPHYHYNASCSACVVEMLTIVYQYYNSKI